MIPACAELVLTFGLPKCAELVALYISLRNSMRKRSVIRKLRAISKSRFTKPGARITLRAELPKLNCAGVANAVGSYQRSTVRSPRPRLGSRNRFGRAGVVVLAGFGVTVGDKGKPDCTLKIPPNCQPPKIALAPGF